MCRIPEDQLKDRVPNVSKPAVQPNGLGHVGQSEADVTLQTADRRGRPFTWPAGRLQDRVHKSETDLHMSKDKKWF